MSERLIKLSVECQNVEKCVGYEWPFRYLYQNIIIVEQYTAIIILFSVITLIGDSWIQKMTHQNN